MTEGSSLLGEALELVRAELGRFIHFRSDADLDTVVLFTAASYIAPELEVAPYLSISSPMWGCGKSTLAGLIQRFGFRGWMVTAPSPAFVFRMIDERPDSLMVIDEVDSVLKQVDKSETAGLIAAIVNAGNTRDTAKIGRVERRGNSQKAVLYSCFGFKVLSGIGDTLPAPTASRAIKIELERARGGELAEEWEPTPYQSRCISDTALILQEAMTSIPWGWDNGSLQPQVDLSNRQRQLWRPLVAVAQQADGVWKDRVRAAIEQIGTTDDQTPTLIVDLARTMYGEPEALFPPDSILDLSMDTTEGPAIATQAIIDALLRLDGSIWVEGTLPQLTPHRFGKLLAEYGHTSKQRREVGSERRMRGYLITELQDVVSRYSASTPFGSETTRQTQQTQGKNSDSEARHDPSASRFELGDFANDSLTLSRRHALDGGSTGPEAGSTTEGQQAIAESDRLAEPFEERFR